MYHTLPTFAYSGFFEYVVVLQYSRLIGCICEAVIQSTVRVHASTLEFVRRLQIQLSGSLSALGVWWLGIILVMSLRVWGSPHELCSPLQAESAALLWAVRLAAQENWHQAVFEGVTKACFLTPLAPWISSLIGLLISTSISNIRCLAVSFAAFKFSWVLRNCNSAAHVAARLAFKLL